MSSCPHSSPTPAKSASKSSLAILVKGPEYQEETEEGAGWIEDARCQSVDLADSPAKAPSPLLLKVVPPQAPFLLQSMFRGNNDDSHHQQHEERELEEHPLSSSGNHVIVNRNCGDDSNSLVNTGYKYEFSDVNNNTAEQMDGNCCQHQNHDETGQDYDDDDDGDDHSDILDHATFDPLLPLGGSNMSFTASGTDQYNNSLSESGTPRIYLLGKSYDPDRQYDQKRDDELSLFWFTYRCDFPEIVPYQITTDAGWGCMLRSAQMMLAQALRVHFKSRQWRSHRLSIAQRRRETFLRSLLSWMADFPSAGYSLHDMVAAGMSKYEILPGEWYGPGTACYVVRDLVHAHETRQLALWSKRQQQQQKEQQKQKEQEQEDQTESQATPNTTTTASSIPNRVFRVFVAPQGTVYNDAIRELMTKESRTQYEETKQKSLSESGPKQVPDHPLATAEQDLKDAQQEQQSLLNLEWDTALLLLIPLRLGLNGINDDYAKSISYTFSIPQSVGVLGGRPRGARW